MDPFLLKVLLSFIVGGCYVAFSTTIAEKFGSSIGGFISGLPSTVAFSLFFIAWSQGESAAVAAAPIVPVMVGASSLFVLTYIRLIRINKVLAPIGSLFVWLVLGFVLLKLKFDNIYLSIFLFVIIWLFTVFFLRKIPSQKISVPFSLGSTILKVMLSGGVVALAVFLSKTLGPLWGGLFAGFPAVFLSTMLLLTYLRGQDFAIAVGKTMPLGTLATMLYPLLVYLTYPTLGFITGTVIAYVSSVAFAAIAYKPVLKWMEARS